MTRRMTAPRDLSDRALAARRPGGRNPRNRPAADLDGTPPQPAAPPESPVDEQQDQEPLHAEPLLNPPYPLPNSQREIKNG